MSTTEPSGDTDRPADAKPADAGSEPVTTEATPPVTETSGIAGSAPSGDPVHVDGVEAGVEAAPPAEPVGAPGHVDTIDEGQPDRLVLLGVVGDVVGIVERSPEFHAALITGEVQAGHQYPHDRP